MNWKLLTLVLSLVATWHGAAGTLVQFRTVFGTVEVELYDQEKPVTTANFKRLVQANAYTNTFIHRLIPGFVAQGGGYSALSKASTNPFAPPWTELGSVPSFGPITNEYSFGPLLSNTNGTIAMAKVSGNPDSATTGWFFNLANNSANLDNQNGGFTVFGQVIRDASNVLPLLNGRTYSNGLVNMGWWYPANFTATNLFTTLPVIYGGYFQPAYGHLLFVDITLLEVAISQTNGLPLISWSGIVGKTNTVEFTASMPPLWQHLYHVVPVQSGRVGVYDNTATTTDRFYRVRVDY